MKKESLIELDYTPDLNRKIINKVGVPGDNLPDNLMQFMCKHYENDTIIIGKRILVIRMLDLAKQYAVKNTVTYFTDNKEKYDEFLKVINNGEKFGGDDEVEFIEDWTKLGDIIENMPKFDIIIGNPPYAGKGTPLYLSILEQVKPLSKKVVWLCPSQWVKNYKDSPFIAKIKNETCADLIEHMNVGNPFEEAGLANEVAIFHFGKADKYEKYEDIRLERFAKPALAKHILSKLMKYNDNLNLHDFKKNDKTQTGFWVNCSWLRGNVHEAKPCWDWTTLFSEENKTSFSFVKGQLWHHWKFETKNECKNFVNSIDCDILMFAIFCGKVNTSITGNMLELVPWFGDYTHEWTEEMIQKELKLTDEEVEYIHEEMKNFGWKAQPKK